MARVMPTNNSGSASVHLLRTAGTAIAKEYVRDRIVEKLIDFPAVSNATGPADLLGQGTGTPALSEINTAEICGLVLDANSESFGALWLIDQRCDITQPVDVGVLWSNSEAAGTGSGLFVAVVTELIAGTTAMAVGATVMDTPITGDVDLAANVVDWSPYGVIAAGSLTTTLVPNDDLLAWKFSVTLTTIANAAVYMARIRYYAELI